MAQYLYILAVRSNANFVVWREDYPFLYSRDAIGHDDWQDSIIEKNGSVAVEHSLLDLVDLFSLPLYYCSHQATFQRLLSSMELQCGDPWQ